MSLYLYYMVVSVFHEYGILQLLHVHFKLYGMLALFAITALV